MHIEQYTVPRKTRFYVKFSDLELGDFVLDNILN